MFKNDVEFIKETFKAGKDDFLPLHPPYFDEREIELTTECIKSTFVSSVGQFVVDFENKYEKRGDGDCTKIVVSFNNVKKKNI